MPPLWPTTPWGWMPPHMANNDAYPFLRATGDLLHTGPTQTNVNDLLAVFVFELALHWVFAVPA